MKNATLVLFGIVIFNCAYSQDLNETNILSNAEKFSAKSGTLISKEFLKVGTIKDAEISVIHYTDLINNESMSSVRFENEIETKYSTDTKTAFLDGDEIDGLIKSIKLIQNKVFSSTPSNYTEVSFSSRSGFQAGCYWSKNTWKTYLKLEKYDGKSYVFLNKEDFPELLNLIEKANSLLKP